MMLRNLLGEIVRRRLWPIPVLALLVAVAAPVLFLKSSPAGAPAADSAAPSAEAGKLPARAERLLAATDSTPSRGRATGSARDPFAPPSEALAAARAAAGATTPAAGAKAGADKPASSSKSGAGASPAAPSAGTTPAPAATIPVTPSVPATTATPELTAENASVSVRFGPRAGSRVHRAIPRLQPYYIHGKLAAVFVKYSPSRHRAVFAIAPGLVVTGPVKCRRQDGVCRYLDIPSGSYARLTLVTADRIAVTRRLDVVRIGRGSGSQTAATVANDRGVPVCLLHRLQALKPGDAQIDRDACEG